MSSHTTPPLKQKQTRFLLLTHPRSGSNLLVRMLSLPNRPDIQPRKAGGYFFAPPFFLHGPLKLLDRHLSDWNSDEKAQLLQSYQDAVDALEGHVGAAEEGGKVAFVKEHVNWLAEPWGRSKVLFAGREDGEGEEVEEGWMVRMPEGKSVPPELSATRSPGNETVMPDEYLRLWRPVFLIRHPALAFPSDYRAVRDLRGVDGAKEDRKYLTLHMTLHFTRKLYDWYSQSLGEEEAKIAGQNDDDVRWPILLDADDVMTKPDVLIRLSEIVGLDTAYLQFNWKAATEEDMQTRYPDDGIRRMASTIAASSGVVAGKTSAGLDLDAEVVKWKEEFGDAEGERVERWVKAAMPDYEYLTARRLKARSR